MASPERPRLRWLLVGLQNAYAALRMADRAYVMELGRVVMRGTGQELLRDDGVARTYLGG